jgi:dipeptidyl aminopeptidase/acylaminoacyl peptidase
LAFDFTGSGMSDGDYVSLGYYEKQDVSAIVDYLWSTKRVSRIGLWGRSMGAATSIMYSSMDSSVSGIVVDSPFVSLEELIQELVLSNQAWVPRKLIKMGVGIMKRSIQSRAGFNIRENAPIEKARKCFVPCLFAHAEGDDFIRIHHSEKLYEAYGGDKNLIRFEGDHNSERPDFFYDSVCIFFYNVLISNDPSKITISHILTN